MTTDGFYHEAASIVEKVRNGKGRIKSLCYNSKHRNKKGLFAVVTEVLKRKSLDRAAKLNMLDYALLEETLQKAKFFETEKKVGQDRE